MKGANKYMFDAAGPFRTQNGSSSQLWIRCKNCFTILHNERGQERHESYINVFSEKNPIWGNSIILPKNGTKNFIAAIIKSL